MALLVALLYPGRQPADLAWVPVPLWGLAAIAIDRLAFNRDERALTLPALGQSAMIVILVAFMAIEMSGFLRFTETLAFWRVGVLLAGAVALIGLTTTLVGMGLNWPTGRLGLVWGLGLVPFVYGLSQTLNYSGPGLDGPRGVVGGRACTGPGQPAGADHSRCVDLAKRALRFSLEAVSPGRLALIRLGAARMAPAAPRSRPGGWRDAPGRDLGPDGRLSVGHPPTTWDKILPGDFPAWSGIFLARPARLAGNPRRPRQRAAAHSLGKGQICFA